MTSSLFFPSPSYSLLLHPLSRTEGSSPFSLPSPLLFFPPAIRSTLSPHCLSHHLLLCSDPKPPFSLLSTPSFTLSQLGIHLKPSRLRSLLASFSWSSSPHRISHTLFTSPQFGSAAGMSRPQLFMPNNTVSLFSRAPQSVYPSVLPCFILQF